MRIKPRNARHGIAAVEFALLLPALVLMLVLLLYLGRICWHYTVIQKAAENGARSLAVMPLVTMKDPNNIGHATQLAENVVRAHLVDIHPGDFGPSFIVLCNGMACNGFTAPATVRVVVQVYMQDMVFPEFMQVPMTLTGDATVAYLGK